MDPSFIQDGIARDLLAASANIGQEALALLTYCQENANSDTP